MTPSTGEHSPLLGGKLQSSKNITAEKTPSFLKIFVLYLLVCLTLTGIVVMTFSQMPGDKTQPREFFNVKVMSGKKKSKVAAKKLAYLNSYPSKIGGDTCESTVLIVRHYESGDTPHETVPNDNNTENGDYRGNIEGCNSIGMQRSLYLATLFSHGRNQRRWPQPAFLYALGNSSKLSGTRKEVQTLQPLEENIRLGSNGDGIQINAQIFNPTKLAHVIFKNLKKGYLCNRIVLVSVSHYSDISMLALEMGCGPSGGCRIKHDSGQYDDVWQLNYVYGFPNTKTMTKGKDSTWQVFGTVVQENFSVTST